MFLEFLQEADQHLFLAINGLHNTFFDWIMVFASGELTWLPLYLILFYLIIREYKWKTWIVFVFVFLLILLSDQLSVQFKNVFQRLRPCHNEEIALQIHLVVGCGGMYGFVSSHAANSFALVFFVLGVLKSQQSWLPWVMFSYAFLVIYSRVYLGAHYPVDVLVGALLGFLVAKIVLFIFYSANKKWNFLNKEERSKI